MSWSNGQRWPDLGPGQRLGKRYLIVDFLGRGWEGEVYKVREIGTGIERAAKLFYPKRNPRGRTLKRYANKLHRLKHVSSIIQYHHRDSISFNGRTLEFMVSEYVEGELLSVLLRAQPGKRFASFEALHILRAIALGVAPIHRLGEYHGDLHTGNIILRRRGIGFDIKLLDFFDLGRSSAKRMGQDVLDLICVLYELVGGRAHYPKAGSAVKRIVRGRRRSLILGYAKNADDLLRAIDSLAFE